MLQKSFLREGWQSHKPCARKRVALANSSANKHMKQATLQPMVFRQLATDARVPVTNSKHCGSDAMRLTGCCIDCLFQSFILWTIAAVPPVLAITSVSCWSSDTYTSDRHCYNFHALVSVAVRFLEVQLLAASSNSNLGEVYIIGFLKACSYSGIRCKAIWDAKKELKQVEW